MDKKNPLSQSLNDCDVEIWKISTQLKSYANLFQSLSHFEVHADSFYGVGISLEEMHFRLEKVLETIRNFKSV